MVHYQNAQIMYDNINMLMHSFIFRKMKSLKMKTNFYIGCEYNVHIQDLCLLFNYKSKMFYASSRYCTDYIRRTYVTKVIMLCCILQTSTFKFYIFFFFISLMFILTITVLRIINFYFVDKISFLHIQPSNVSILFRYTLHEMQPKPLY